MLRKQTGKENGLNSLILKRGTFIWLKCSKQKIILKV